MSKRKHTPQQHLSIDFRPRAVILESDQNGALPPPCDIGDLPPGVYKIVNPLTEELEGLDPASLALVTNSEARAGWKLLEYLEAAKKDDLIQQSSACLGLIDQMLVLLKLSPIGSSRTLITIMQPYDQQVGAHAVKSKQTSTAKVAANARHDKPNGSRGKASKIRDIWASGKYSSRDICAEQESAAIGMSFSAARKALRNTPKPST